jgi:hypothetical protein
VIWLQAAWAVVKGLIDLVASILRLVPWWVYFWLFLAAVVWAVFHGEQRYAAGQAERQGLWDAATAEQNQRIRELEAESGKVTVKTEVQVVERIKTVHEKGATIVREVPVYIPADTCELPGGMRVIHDAAARNEVPDPASAADAAGVSAQTLAATVAENYAGCHENAVKLKGWQEWAANMKALYGGSKDAP